jgi:hypothetical protein
MVDFKNIKGGDPEGQAKNNSKKPEKKTESNPIENMIQDKLDELFAKRKDTKRDIDREYDFPITPLDKSLILLFWISNMLEDEIEDFIINNRIEDFEHELSPTFTIATELREAIHTTIENQMRHRFSTEEILSLAHRINRDA